MCLFLLENHYLFVSFAIGTDDVLDRQPGQENICVEERTRNFNLCCNDVHFIIQNNVNIIGCFLCVPFEITCITHALCYTEHYGTILWHYFSNILWNVSSVYAVFL